MSDIADDPKLDVPPAGGGAAKFADPGRCASGAPRARVALTGLRTLWVNTGTLCNIACANCYIESTPTNDRLAYFRRADLTGYLDEIAAHRWPVTEIGFTGGEPFMNPDLIDMLADCLGRGFKVLVLTNAMKPMERKRAALKHLRDRYGDALAVRVSVDHYGPALHEDERGVNTFEPTMAGLQWLAENGFAPRVAGRTRWGEDEGHLRTGYAALFAARGLGIDAADTQALVLFPEMDEGRDVPEITTACWGILGVDPADMMCASARMVVRRKGAGGPAVLACTLIAYDPAFEMGRTLADSLGEVALNHPHCARFCVLGGGACSRG